MMPSEAKERNANAIVTDIFTGKTLSIYTQLENREYPVGI
jgi:hypothetical protein